MCRIRVDPMVSIVRCYRTPIDSKIPLCKMKEHFYKSFPIMFLDNGVARLTAVMEIPSFKERLELKEYLREIGYHTVEWRHEDKIITTRIK